MLPSFLLDQEAADARRAAVPRAGPAGAGDRRATGCDRPLVARVLTEMGENFVRFQLVAQREAEQRDELAVSPEVVASVPYFESDIYDLAGLLRLGEQIWIVDRFADAALVASPDVEAYAEAHTTPPD